MGSKRDRSPAFQFYPDKWLSHAGRLDDSTYRIYHEILCHMWLRSSDYCSISSNPADIALCLGMPIAKIEEAMKVLLHPGLQLLQEGQNRIVSLGLKKERDHQSKVSAVRALSRKARTDKELERQQMNNKSLTKPNTTTTTTTTTILDFEEANASSPERLERAKPHLAKEQAALVDFIEPFPCLSGRQKDPDSWIPTDKKMREWWRIYSGTVDVCGEIDKARSWIHDNGRKTFKGMPKFISAWLTSAVGRRDHLPPLSKNDMAADVSQRRERMRQLKAQEAEHGQQEIAG